MKKILFIIIGMLLTLITVAQADPINLALTGTATQSSTYSWYINLEAKNAIDGNTDGNIYNGSVTHTYEEYQPWWQVDLLNMSEIDQIVIWNRTDSCSYRLSNFNVSVISPNNTIVWTDNYFTTGGYPDPYSIIDLPDNIFGQIVKVRLNGAEYLSLAEVQVFGTPVPEPATMLLLGSGLIGLAGYGRKKFIRSKYSQTMEM
jgi:hypothetical protein